MIAPGRSKPGKGLQKDLHDAIRLCSYNDLRRAIQNGADVNSGDYLDKSDFYPLLQACADSKGLWIVRLLIEHGARVDVKDADGTTALMRASLAGHIDVVRLLLDKGAGVGDTDTEGETALHLASRRGHTDIVRLLLENGADVNAADKDGWTPLHESSGGRFGWLETVRLLIEYGADVNAKNNTGGFTPLHLACRYGRADTTKLLLSHGADPALVTENGDTAIEYALELEKADPCREKILSLFQQFAPELYFSTFCTAPVNSGGM